MCLAATLPIDTKAELTLIVRLYSWRWAMMTFGRFLRLLAMDFPSPRLAGDSP